MIDPSRVRRLHLIAVCGTGMAALAAMLKAPAEDVAAGVDVEHEVRAAALLQLHPSNRRC
jgi:UDP-N-acetylmuramate-alanine ligase